MHDLNNEKKKVLTDFQKVIFLTVIFAVILIVSILIRKSLSVENSFVDGVANQISQEMSENKIVLSSGTTHRTVVDFEEPIILAHGKESRLIVYNAQLSEKVSISNEVLGGWSLVSAYQEMYCTGIAEYTVDLSKLSEDDFVVNNELKTLTVKIPYAVLSPINIPADQIKFSDVQHGWLASKDIQMTPEENAQLLAKVNTMMKAKLIDDNTLAAANKAAKIVVADLLSATVQSIDPEYTVIVVQ